MWAVAAVVMGSSLATGGGLLVYDNLKTPDPLGRYIGGVGTYEEIADDIQMAAGGVFSSARVAYEISPPFQGTASLTLTLRRLDGLPTPATDPINTPGTLLYSDTIDLDGSGLAVFTDPTPDVLLPSYIVVGLTFHGLDPASNSDAGPALYNPPVIKNTSSFDDYWHKPISGDWELRNFLNANSEPDPYANFGLQISVIPEPRAWAVVAGLGALLTVALRRRFGRQNA
jgi:hypothetical protein